jgi:GrxC family glutaredoxin
MAGIEIYTRSWCGYCRMAKSLLQSLGCEFSEYDIGGDQGLETEMTRRTGGRTVPQVLIDGTPVGGFTELARLHGSGALQRMLAGRLSPGAP